MNTGDIFEANLLIGTRFGGRVLQKLSGNINKFITSHSHSLLNVSVLRHVSATVHNNLHGVSIPEDVYSVTIQHVI